MPEAQRRRLAGRLAGLFYWPAKLGQVLLLLAAAAALLYGLYETGANVYYTFGGEAVQGRVANVETLGGGRGEAAGEALHFPTIAYQWPPESPDSRWIVSVVPRDDLRAGDLVLVRVLPEMPDLGRQEMPFWWYTLVFALLLGGLLAVRQLETGWYRLDAAFGRQPSGLRGEALFDGPAGRRLVLFAGLPILLLAGAYVYFVPYLKPTELGYLVDGRERLLQIAGARGGAPVEGPLNRHERRLLSLPVIGGEAAAGGFERALRLGDVADLRRYIAAIADPGIAFPVDLERLSALLMARQTEILALLLDTGIEVPPEAGRRMLEIALRQRNEAKLRVLAARGIQPLATAAR